MKILALESSAAACSAALCEDETLIDQFFQNSGLTSIEIPSGVQHISHKAGTKANTGSSTKTT